MMSILVPGRFCFFVFFYRVFSLGSLERGRSFYDAVNVIATEFFFGFFFFYRGIGIWTFFRLSNFRAFQGLLRNGLPHFWADIDNYRALERINLRYPIVTFCIFLHFLWLFIRPKVKVMSAKKKPIAKFHSSYRDRNTRSTHPAVRCNLLQ